MACIQDRQIHCRFDQYFYSADIAEKEYREGLNISEDDLKKIGKLIQPLIKQGLSPYSILKSLPDINVSEKALYNYIESGAFKNVGIDIIPLDLRKQLTRKIKIEH